MADDFCTIDAGLIAFDFGSEPIPVSQKKLGAAPIGRFPKGIEE
jgi:hypothetical protein